MMKYHYSPKAQVVLNKKARRGEGLIALSTVPTPNGVIRLASPESLQQYAGDLYSAFRLADRFGLNKVTVIVPKGTGLIDAILDRVKKASSSKK